MAKEASVRDACAITHFQTCLLHDNERATTCSGTLKRGGKCVNKAVGPLDPCMMPTCKIHRDQLKISAFCRAPLPCGFECGRLCEWKFHGFQLCPDHVGCPMACFFLKIPIEMRLRIYRFLLPDRPIPARFGYSTYLTSDHGRVYAAILRVNHQIRDEAAGLLYATRVFTIELSEDGLSMCNSSKRTSKYVVSGIGNHALQDYQMQLMLLEQQNKKRLLMARQEQSNINGASSSTYVHVIRDHQPRARSPIPCMYGPIEPIWDPPLSERYFNMIQSFLIEIVFPFPSGTSADHHRAVRSPNADAANQKALELKLYDYCDHIHRLIGRLRRIKRPIARLEIVIKFGNTYAKGEEVFPAASFLLRPFQRLRNVVKPEVLSIKMNGFQGHEIELLSPSWISSAAGRIFADYLEYWFKDPSSSQSSLECPPVFDAYWQLEKLLSIIKKHYHHADPKFEYFAGLLHGARLAREANDLTHFREVWDQVVNIWFDYLNYQKEFQSNVALSIDAIYATVRDGS